MHNQPYKWQETNINTQGNKTKEQKPQQLQQQGSMTTTMKQHQNTKTTTKATASPSCMTKQTTKSNKK